MLSFCKGFVTYAVLFGYFLSTKASQLYLQPSKTEHGFFTNESFFITCFTTDESSDKLTWIGNDENEITATEGRIHIQPATGLQQGLELVVESVRKDDAGRYVCSDERDSISFELIVYRSISFTNTEKNQYSSEGENAALTCHVKADPKPVVNWYYNGSKLSSSEKYKISSDSLKIYSVNRSDAGIYKCEAIVITALSSQVNDFDINFSVQYTPDFADGKETEVFASINTSASLTCTVFANPLPIFEWSQYDKTIYNSSEYMIYNNENESILRVNIRDKSQFGMYTCEASNVLGSAEKVINLKQGEVPPAPVLSVVNEDQGVLTLDIKMLNENEDDESSLKTTGFKVQYIIASETWDQADVVEFQKGDEYLIKNMSYNTAYIFRATALNAIGYGNYSEEVPYTTHALQVAPVVADSSMHVELSSLVLFIICLIWILI